MLVDMFLDNFPMLMASVGLVLLISVSTYVPDRMRKMTRKAILLLVAENLCYNLERWTQTFETLSLLRPFLTASVYSSFPIILYFVMRIVMEENPPRKKLVLLLLPQMVCIPLYFTSQWTHLVCWFSQNNEYVAGPLARLPYVIFVLYSLAFLYLNYVYFKSFNNRDRRTVVYMVLTPLLGAFLYQILRRRGDFATLLSVAILLYYSFIYIHMAKIDPLTGLFNRMCFYEDLQFRSKALTGIASVDMNDLKYFNDNMGHQAGDVALHTVAEVLREFCGQGGTVYRVGGDEFIILYSYAGETWIRSAISDMRAELSKTPYTCAFGYAMIWLEDGINEAMQAADQAMYADKEAVKAKQGGSRRTSHQRAWV